MTCVIISLFILTSYVISVCAGWGIPDSISQTFFSIKNKWIFSAVMVACFCLLFPSLMELLPSKCQWLGFLTVAGGILIAFAPNLNDDLEEKVHMFGAALMGAASQCVAAVLCPAVLWMWTMFFIFIKRKERVFFAEIIGGMTLYTALIVVGCN